MAMMNLISQLPLTRITVTDYDDVVPEHYNIKRNERDTNEQVGGWVLNNC